jgi:hypothetical protein
MVRVAWSPCVPATNPQPPGRRNAAAPSQGVIDILKPFDFCVIVCAVVLLAVTAYANNSADVDRNASVSADIVKQRMHDSFNKFGFGHFPHR